MKVEKLTVELSLANDSIGKLTKEHSSVNDLVACLKSEKSIAQESLTSLEEKYQNLELNYSTLWASTSTSPKATEDSNVSTSNGCCLHQNLEEGLQELKSSQDHVIKESIA